MIEHTHEIAITDTKISELIQTVSRERPKMIHDRLRAHYALLAEILQLGNDSGEFEVVDVGKTARYLYSALVIFDVPIFVGSTFGENAPDLARIFVPYDRDGFVEVQFIPIAVRVIGQTDVVDDIQFCDPVRFSRFDFI